MRVLAKSNEMRLALLGLAALGLSACAQQNVAEKPAWTSDLDRRYAEAMAPSYASGAAKDASAVEAAVNRPMLSFAVESADTPEQFAARLKDVADRCWVADDKHYTADKPSPTVITLAYHAPKAEDGDAEPVEALRLVTRAAKDGKGLAVDAVGPLAENRHQRVIERGLRQAGADLSACL